MTAATTAAPSVIEQARAILTQADAASFRSAEAKAMTGYARACLLAELDVHDRLASGAMRWEHLDADLMFYGGDDEAARREALAVQAGRCREAALAYRNRVAEYVRREDATQAHVSTVAAPAAGDGGTA